MSSSLTLAGIDTAIESLSYRNASPKMKLLRAIRAYYPDGPEAAAIPEPIHAESVIPRIWAHCDTPDGIRSRQKNLASLRAAINKDLQKLDAETNPEGIVLSPDYRFVMDDSAKERILDAVSGLVDTSGNLVANRVGDLLQLIRESLMREVEDSGKSEWESILPILGDLDDAIRGETASEDGDYEIVEMGADDEIVSEDAPIEEEMEEDFVEDDDGLLEESGDLEASIEGETDFGEMLPDEDLTAAFEDWDETQDALLDAADEFEAQEEVDDTENIDLLEEDDPLLSEEEATLLAEGMEDSPDDFLLEEDEEILERNGPANGEEEADFLEEAMGEDGPEAVSEGDGDADSDDWDFEDEEDLFSDLEEESFDADFEDEYLAASADSPTEQDELLEEDGASETEERDDFGEEGFGEGDELAEEDEESLDGEDDLLEDPPEENGLSTDLGLPMDPMEDVGPYNPEDKEKNRLLSERFDGALGSMERFFNQYLLVNGGSYRVGASTPNARSHTEKVVRIPDFYMGKFPITNALFEVFVEQTGYKTTAERIGHGTVFRGRVSRERNPDTGEMRKVWNATATSEAVSGACWYQPEGPGSGIHLKRNHPVVQVSFADALRFAAWIGKRLPAEEEWEACARGTGANPWPWGAAWEEDMANIERYEQGETTPVNHFPEGKNEFFLEDLLGNVMEWTTTRMENPQGVPESIRFRAAKGGSFVSPGLPCLWERFPARESFSANILGFRCVVD